MHKRYTMSHSVLHDVGVLPKDLDAMSTLAFLRRSGRVRRYHTEELLKPQDVAQHSYGVAWLCWWLTEGAASAPLVLHALAHDAAEHGLGDIPSPTKRELGIRQQVDAAEAHLMALHGIVLPDLSAFENKVLKLADALDGVLHCTHELELGNQTLYAVFLNFHRYGLELVPHGTAPSTDCVEGRAMLLLKWAAERWSALTK
ncbi:HD domain-containing protein [Patescibacteria group bacterium]|nr:HD domain-containing protein [Patescibacteria group bacterium]